MKTFEYVALSQTGLRTRGVITAPDELTLDRDLEAQGLSLLTAKPMRSGQHGGKVRLSARELVSMTTQMATLLRAGVPILESLEGLEKQMRSEDGQELVKRLSKSIQSGQSFSEALGAFPESFSTVYRAAVKAGEMTGALPAVLSNQAAFLEWSAEIRSTTIQALFYPVMLVMAIGGLVTVMITFVLPRIVGMMPGGQEQLPGPTLFLMNISDFLTSNWLPIGLGLMALAGAAYAALRHKPTATSISRALLYIPRLGELLSMLAISRFARTASTLQEAGCDMLSVLEVSSVACGNKAFQASFDAARQQIASGERLSIALESQPKMDPLLIQMVQVGEDTGELDSCLGQLSNYYDKEVPRMVKWFLALLEPVILLSAGALVAFILLAAILPMMSLYENM